MRLLYALFVLSFCVQYHIVLIQASEGVADVFSSVYTVVKTAVNKVENKIPNPVDLSQVSKEILIGLPEIAVFKTIHELCSLYMSLASVEPRVTPNMKFMALVLHTPCKTESISLGSAANILNSDDFDIKKKVAIFVTGWMARPDEDYVHDMAKAFNCRGDYNFLVLDTSDSIDTLYNWAAYNTAEVGRMLAVVLEKLVERVPLKNIHLIGHSLGAHIVGYAGRYFNRYTGLNITRITALDPANPCFNEGHVLTGLQRGDADFIDIIHTNPSVLGKGDPFGDVDFYPEGLDPIKPGCLKLGCSHGRAYEYFTESVYPSNERNFLAVRCTSLTSLKLGFCRGYKFPMGLAVPFHLKGNYFLSVNAEKPYGKNSHGHDTTHHHCGGCQLREETYY